MLVSRVPTRWRLFSVLFLLSFLSYLMRQNIHVAGEFMMPELGISEIEMGWIYAAFIWGYALCQLPGGVFGKLLGPRVALTCAGVGGRKAVHTRTRSAQVAAVGLESAVWIASELRVDELGVAPVVI